MLRTFASRTSIFPLIAWFAVIATTVDALNLDDLLPGTLTIHDSCDLAVTPGSDDGAAVGVLSRPMAIATPVPPRGPEPRTKIIFDEDSPSLVGDFSLLTDLLGTISSEDSLPPWEAPPPTAPIHVLSCSWLI